MQTITEIGLRRGARSLGYGCRIAVYSHDTFGLGNIRRMLAICQHLIASRDDCSILLITGSPVIHRLPLPTERFDYVKLPCLSRTDAERYQVRTLGTGLNHTVALRAQMIKTVLENYQPDLILVDKKPCGVERELVPALYSSTSLSLSAHWVLLLRDILDEPQKTREVWHKHDYFEVIEHFYSQVLVVGSQAIFDLGREYDFPANVKGKMRYCGYIHKNCQAHFPPQSRPASRRVLVTPGGGQDGCRLIKMYLQGCRETPLADLDTIVVTGPEMDPKSRQEIELLAAGLKKPVEVRTFTDNMEGMMAQADVVLAMGGYNTVCELVSLGKKAVIVPRKHPVQEQWIRARRFAQLGLLHCLDPDTLTPRGLIEAIESQLSREPAPSLLPSSEWSGLERVSDAIRTLLNEPGLSVCQA